MNFFSNLPLHLDLPLDIQKYIELRWSVGLLDNLLKDLYSKDLFRALMASDYFTRGQRLFFLSIFLNERLNFFENIFMPKHVYGGIECMRFNDNFMLQMDYMPDYIPKRNSFARIFDIYEFPCKYVQYMDIFTDMNQVIKCIHKLNYIQYVD
tara:strand:+ start:352 stop:807 length:456 start_codon:yes stop_codon:yes gene_type:complete